MTKRINAFLTWSHYYVHFLNMCFCFCLQLLTLLLLCATIAEFFWALPYAAIVKFYTTFIFHPLKWHFWFFFTSNSTIFDIQFVAMETRWDKRYQSFCTEKFLQEILFHLDSVLNEISDYKFDFNPYGLDKDCARTDCMISAM